MRVRIETHRIEFVYFDLGNVLLSFDPARACRNLASRFKITDAQARAAVYESGLQDRFEHGQVSGEQFAEDIRQRLGSTESAMPTLDVLNAVSDMFTPVAAMRGVLQKVRDQGCRVGLLSNTCHAHWDWIERQNYEVIDFQFDVTILSFEVGSMKPEEKIYGVAENAAGVKGDRILFLDDKQENVDAALRRDWHAVRFVGGPQAIAALKGFRLMSELS
jgi:FMN phosphatase YigB (HAD superfamily)